MFSHSSLVRGEAAAWCPETNLGELLKRKAADGVRVLVMTWNEKSNDSGLLEGLMGTHDEETYGYFYGTDVICTNVPRAKKSWLGLGGQFVGTLYTHHQKNVVCDADIGDGMKRVVAFVGGIDLTNGRYDTPEFHLFKTLRTLHAGDFYQVWADLGTNNNWYVTVYFVPPHHSSFIKLKGKNKEFKKDEFFLYFSFPFARYHRGGGLRVIASVSDPDPGA